MVKYFINDVYNAIKIIDKKGFELRDLKRKLYSTKASDDIIDEATERLKKLYQLKRSVLKKLVIQKYLTLEGYYIQKYLTLNGIEKEQKIFKYSNTSFEIFNLGKLDIKGFNQGSGSNTMIGTFNGFINIDEEFNTSYTEALYILKNYLYDNKKKLYEGNECKKTDINKLIIGNCMKDIQFNREVVDNIKNIVNENNNFIKEKAILVTKEKEGRKIVYKIMRGINRYKAYTEIGLKKVYVSIIKEI